MGQELNSIGEVRDDSIWVGVEEMKGIEKMFLLLLTSSAFKYSALGHGHSKTNPE
jgi:hypothetical protein